MGATLVLGATGTTGRRVADRLARRGVDVRSGSRRATPAFDWEDAATWDPALVGVEAAYIAYAPDLAVPGAAEVVGAFARRAVAAGVRRLVLLSGRGEEGAMRAEAAVREAGADWTVVRSAWFAQNFSEGLLHDAVLASELALPAGDVAEPFIDVEDVADVAVAALTEPCHAGLVYEVTGPRLLTFAEAAAEIAAASGRQVRYAPVTREEHEAAMAQAGVPGDLAALLSELFAEVLDGRNASLGDGVRRALGREPRDFAAFARDAAAAGAWTGTAVPA